MFKKERFWMNRIAIIISVIILFSIAAFGTTMINEVNRDTPVNVETTLPPVLQGISGIKTPVNVFVLAGDQSSGNTDTMMVVNFNPKTCETKIISVPRDTGVIIDEHLRKINFAYPSHGIEFSAKTLGTLLGINIDYYVYIDTKIFREVIDILGGVKYYVPVDMDYDDNSQNLHIHFKKGWYHFDGRNAEEFVRFRKPNQYSSEIFKYYDGGDLKRIDAQQKFITELVRQKTKAKYLPQASKLLKSIFANIKTDMPIQTAIKLLYNIKELDVNKVATYRAFGKSDIVDSLWFYFFKNQLYSDATKKYEKSDEFIAANMQTKGLLFKADPEATRQFRLAIENRVSSLSGSDSHNNSNNNNNNNNKPKATKKPVKPTKKPVRTPKPTRSPVITEAPKTPAPTIEPEPTEIVQPTEEALN